ncbi:hypothetical protein ACKC9G_12475 [Pokkaliibacter sp. CJK22405]|uniref:hypothetical protein n=1 Tax=Pokkaliibacter sp. CJK22405 TaxID=3384615 RepID=UPI003984E520
MSSSINPVLKQFLSNKGMDFSQEINLAEDSPFIVTVDDSFAVFLDLKGNEKIAIFTFVADFDQMDPEAMLMIVSESLKLNSFKWGSKVQYALDPDGRYLMAWTERTLKGVDLQTLETAFSHVQGAYGAFTRLVARIESDVASRKEKEQGKAPVAAEGSAPAAEKKAAPTDNIPPELRARMKF